MDIDHNNHQRDQLNTSVTYSVDEKDKQTGLDGNVKDMDTSSFRNCLYYYFLFKNFLIDNNYVSLSFLEYLFF
jgi:hypothetical protein